MRSTGGRGKASRHGSPFSPGSRPQPPRGMATSWNSQAAARSGGGWCSRKVTPSLLTSGPASISLLCMGCTIPVPDDGRLSGARRRRGRGRHGSRPRPGRPTGRSVLAPAADLATWRGCTRDGPPGRRRRITMLATLTGLGLSAAAGLNAYIPLLLVGVVARWTDAVALPPDFAWIQNRWVLAAVAVLLLAEVVLDKVAVVDHLNDLVQTFVRPAVGGVIFAATAVAGLVHAGKASARPVINVTTFGIATPLVSAAEDGVSLGMSLLALFAPVLVLVGLLLLAVAMVLALRRLRRRWRQRQRPVPA